MSKKAGSILLVISLVALCLSMVSLIVALRPAAPDTQDTQYVLYGDYMGSIEIESLKMSEGDLPPKAGRRREHAVRQL